MVRFFRVALAGSIAALLGGCPIYGGDGYQCDPGYQDCGSGAAGAGGPECTDPSDCGINETCGEDNQCHSGSCEFWGCPTGYECLVEQEGATCVPDGSGSGGSGGDGAGGGPDVTWCGNPDDCGPGETCAPDGTCQVGACTDVGCIFGYMCDETGETPACIHENPAACGNDGDCADFGADYACVSGECTAPADQCFDGTQCPSGDVCADGKCTPACAGDRDCPEVYLCTEDVGLCNAPSQSCTITNDCGGPDLVCVDGGCFPRAEGGACSPGTVWVENGCIPDQSALFVCNVDGTQDACAAGSICLHHSCYISCAPPNGNACAALPDFDQCKAVTTPSGTHQVCGSNENLGSECDPTAGLDCAPGSICIDGFCE